MAQPVEEGTWTGLVTPPGGNPYESSYDVRHTNESLAIRMTVGDWAAEFPLHDVRVENDALRFWWQPTVPVECKLDLQASGVYRGTCRDANGRTAPMMMSPPGVGIESEIERMREAAEAARQEHAKWSQRRELDQVDGPLGDMVDVGGYKLNVLVEGEGDASVVFIADIGDDLRTWDYVVHDAKDFARVVSYSRAGIGYSDANPQPTTIERTALDVYTLLRHTSVDPPYVIVGHGFGAVLARRFASMHPADVAGMVLIEPAHSEFGERLRTIDAPSWDEYWNNQKSFYELAPKAVRDEFELYSGIIDDARAEAAEPDVQVPTAVITSLRAPDHPRWVGETSGGLEAKERLHSALADQFEEGVHITTHESGRYVQREDPDLVVETIRRVLDRIQSTESVLN